MYTQTWGDNHIILYGTSLITVLSMAIHWLYNRVNNMSFLPYGIWNNYIVIAYSIISGIFVAYNYSVLLSSCITYVAFSTICVAICYVSAIEGDFEWLLNTLILVAIICVIYMLFNGQVWPGYGRTLSKKNNPHTFAAVMNLGVFSTAYKCKKNNIKEWIGSALFIILFMYGIIECGSRKYLIVSAFFLMAWGITSFSSIWKANNTNHRVLLVTILCAVVLLARSYYLNVYSTTLSHSRMLNADDQGNLGRVKMYQYALKIFLDKPLLGGGYDQFKYWSGIGGYAHSTYAEAIADFGFIGTIIYFIPIFLATYRIVLKVVKKPEYHNVLLLIFCAMELFLGVGQIFFMEFYHFIAWTIIFYLELQTEKDNEVKEIVAKYKYIRV